MVTSMQEARQRINKKAQVIKDAANTPTGRALIDLINKEFGDPQVVDSQLRSFANLGNFEVVTWLTRMEHYSPRGDET